MPNNLCDTISGMCKKSGCESSGRLKRGLCHRHYREYLDSRGIECEVKDCTKGVRAKNLCFSHYQLFQKYGDPNIRIRATPGSGCINPDGYRVFTINGKILREHRMVMESVVGRKLRSEENVHHLNGDRADNRLENLELWSTSQPRGQRIEDKTAWAVEWLQSYAPELLK